MSKSKKNREARTRIREMVRILDVVDGQVVLIKQGSLLGKEGSFGYFMRYLSRTGRPNCIGVIVDDFTDLSILDESGMNEHGWYKHETDQSA